MTRGVDAGQVLSRRPPAVRITSAGYAERGKELELLDTTTDAGSRAEKRLRDEEVAWLTTVRSDGQPQSVPVWFLWDGESFLIYSQPDRQKLRNIGHNPRVGLNLNSSDTGGDVARVEGDAEILDGFPPVTEVEDYLEKHRGPISRIGYEPDCFAKAYSVALRVTPGRWQVW